MEFTENQARELASLLDVAALACGFAARRGCRPDESQWWPEKMALETPAVGEVQIHVTLDAAAALVGECPRCGGQVKYNLQIGEGICPDCGWTT